MKYTCKITHDGSHFVASIPNSRSKGGGGYHPRRKDAELFDEYYVKAQREGISERNIASWIEENIMMERDISEWIPSERCRELLKNKKRSEHLRYKRYQGKLFLTNFNWYVTFTYDSKKETEESFVKRLKRCFSNFKCREDWRVVAVPEDGEENGRRHWHCFLRIPDGNMVGELFLNKAYSTKRKKYETWTDNTYFNKRFGNSVWKAINKSDLKHGGALRGYLLKYLRKSGNKMYYSRDLPHELVREIDTDTDVSCTYFNHGYKAVLFDSVVNKETDMPENACSLPVFPAERGDGFNIRNLMEKYGYPIFTNDRPLYVIMRELFYNLRRIKDGRFKLLPAPLT